MVQPGWYPDPHEPALLRYHDGYAWTAHRAPSPGAPAPGYVDPYRVLAPVEPTPAGRRVPAWGVGVGFVATLAAVVFAVLVSRPEPVTTSSATTCPQLAEEIVDAAAAQAGDGQPRLLEVRVPYLVEDHQADYELPTGKEKVTLLVCNGAGTWSSGVNAPVRMRLSVDASGQEWLDWGDQ